jgi:tetratricopeptide (TPR) repeat protein
LKHFPAAWQLHYQSAAAAYGQGRYAEAEQEYLRAQSISSAVPKEIHVRLADIYVQQNHYSKAYAELQAYLRVEPEGRFAAKAADVMSRMEKAGVVHASQASPVPAEAETPSDPGRN